MTEIGTIVNASTVERVNTLKARISPLEYLSQFQISLNHIKTLQIESLLISDCSEKISIYPAQKGSIESGLLTFVQQIEEFKGAVDTTISFIKKEQKSKTKKVS